MNEKQYGMMLLLVVAAGFVGGAVSSRLLTGAPARAEHTPDLPKVITAAEFRVVDKKGEIRATLGVHNHSALLKLRDPKGDTVAVLEASNLRFMRVDRLRANLGLSGEDSSYLSLRDKDMSSALTLQVLAQGQPALRLTDKNGEIRAALGLDRDGSAVLVTADKDGQIVWAAP